MASELISFRLSNNELDWLRENCEPGESLNLAAKRMLLYRRVVISKVDSPVNSSVDSVDSVYTLNVSEELKQLQSNLDERLAEIEERLGKLKA